MTKPRRGPLTAGEPVQLTDPKGRSHLITLRAGASFHTHRGTLNHDDIIGGPDGNVIKSQGGTPYVVFRPLLADYTLAMKRGAAVVYPRFELDYSRAVLDHAVAGIRTAEQRLGAGDLPVLAIGHSRGAALAIEYAAVAKSDQVPVPKAIYSVEPVPYGEQTRLVDFGPIDHATRVVLVIGDRDPGASGGAQGLLKRFQQAQFPGTQIKLQFVRSHGQFSADHMAVLGSSPAAQDAFWRPVDRLLEQLES